MIVWISDIDFIFKKALQLLDDHLDFVYTQFYASYMVDLWKAQGLSKSL